MELATILIAACLVGAFSFLAYGVASLLRDRPKRLVLVTAPVATDVPPPPPRPQPRGFVLAFADTKVSDEFSDDNAETTLATRYPGGRHPALIPTLVVRRRDLPRRPHLVTIQEARTAVRDTIAYRPTRRPGER